MKAPLNIALVLCSALALCPRAAVADDDTSATDPQSKPPAQVQNAANATPAPANSTTAATADADAQVNQPTAPAPIQKAANL